MRRPSPSDLAARFRILAALAAAFSLAAGCALRRPPEPVPVPAPAARPVQVALVLGGGGARGFAHVGVLRVLEEEGIPVDLVVGTSAGSLIGALWADRPGAAALEELAMRVTKEDLFDWTLLGATRGPVAGEALENFLRRNLRATFFDQLQVPFVAVATDLVTGQRVELDSGMVAPAVRASSAIPGVFRPVQLYGRTLVDGGVVEPVPVSVARARGADVVIAVDISRELPVWESGNLADVSLRSLHIQGRELTRTKVREADVVIAPEVSDTSPFDLARKREMLLAGVAAARSAVPEIRRAIHRASLRPAPVRTYSQ